jgi:predicted O-methyltransferase YrrM
MNPHHEKAKAVQHYLDDMFAPHDKVLEKVKERMDAHQLPPISISPYIGKLLTILSHLIQANRILEIGTLGGYSTIWLARALPENGQLISLELDLKNAEVARENVIRADLHHKVEIKVGEALKSIRDMNHRHFPKFDLIFLDADKPNYPKYIEPMIQLCRSGGLIIADNLIRRGKIINPSPTDDQANALAEFNRTIASHPQLESVIIPTLMGYLGGDLDGLSISRKK